MADRGKWELWAEYVLISIKEMRDDINRCAKKEHCNVEAATILRLTEAINKARQEIAVLKVKSGIWGAIGAAIPITIGILIWLIKEHV